MTSSISRTQAGSGQGKSPEALEERMCQAVEAVPGSADDARGLADAALDRLRRVLGSAGDRSAAFDLLAADALLTHACGGAATADPEAFTEFAESLLEELTSLLLEPGTTDAPALVPPGSPNPGPAPAAAPLSNGPASATPAIESAHLLSVTHHLEGLAATALRTSETLAAEIAKVAESVLDALDAGHKLLFCGNGGSAADAQHLAAEYVVRLRHQRRPLPALALTTDTSLLTAAANDFGYHEIFARQVQALGSAGDILFLHSTSGDSPNLLAAAEAARERGVLTVALLARGGGKLRKLVDTALVVPTDIGAHAQELHLAIGHLICDIVETRVLLDPVDGGEL